MTRKIRITGPFAAVILGVGAVTAFAASRPPQLLEADYWRPTDGASFRSRSGEEAP
jgi:hypothetical protein